MPDTTSRYSSPMAENGKSGETGAEVVENEKPPYDLDAESGDLGFTDGQYLTLLRAQKLVGR
jgi:hypothetical protein